MGLSSEEKRILRERPPYVCDYKELVEKHFWDFAPDELPDYVADCDKLKKSLDFLKRKKIREMREAMKNAKGAENAPTLEDIEAAKESYTMSSEELSFLRARPPHLCYYDEIGEHHLPGWRYWELLNFLAGHFNLKKNLGFIKRLRQKQKKAQKICESVEAAGEGGDNVSKEPHVVEDEH